MVVGEGGGGGWKSQLPVWSPLTLGSSLFQPDDGRGLRWHG